MDIRYYMLLMLCVQNAFGMMKEENLLSLDRRKELVCEDELPAIVSFLLADEDYNSFRAHRYTYEMDDKRNIVAVQGGLPSVVKIFEHKNGILTEIQEIKDSFYPIVDPLGNGLAVVKKVEDRARCLEYYTRVAHNGAFVSKQTLILDRIIQSAAFNNNGTQLTVTLFVSHEMQEEKEFVKNSEDEFELKKAPGIMRKILTALQGGE